MKSSLMSSQANGLFSSRVVVGLIVFFCSNLQALGRRPQPRPVHGILQPLSSLPHRPTSPTPDHDLRINPALPVTCSQEKNWTAGKKYVRTSGGKTP